MLSDSVTMDLCTMVGTRTLQIHRWVLLFWVFLEHWEYLSAPLRSRQHVWVVSLVPDEAPHLQLNLLMVAFLWQMAVIYHFFLIVLTLEEPCQDVKVLFSF